METELKGRRGSRGSHQIGTQSWLLFCLAAMLQISVAIGQNIQNTNPSIFQYGRTPVVVPINYDGQEPPSPPLQVPTNPGVITQLQNDNLTCLGDFFSIGNFTLSDMGLLLRPGPPVGNQQQVNVSGRCLCRNPVQLLQPCVTEPSVTSFSTLFQMTVFTQAYYWAINSTGFSNFGTLQGLAFVIASDDTTQGEGGGYLGWLNSTTNNHTSGHNFAVELDFFQDKEFDDPVGVHVGVNKNSLRSVSAEEVGAWGDFVFGTQDVGGSPTVNVWIDYDGPTEMLKVFVDIDTSYDFNKPTQPLISTRIDLSDTLSQNMFVGFSGSVSNVTSSNDGQGVGFLIYDWTFNSNGPAPDLRRNSDGTPVNPDAEAKHKQKARNALIAGITVPSAGVFFILMYIISVLYRRNSRLNALAKKYQIEELEHLDRGPQNFKYRALSTATKGFSANELLGTGGFGSVYRGRVWLRGAPKQTDIAVKRISATSHQGAREFLAEVKIIGQVQHRNLVRLLGWCHDKGELLLVYEYMPNGSLDQHLFKNNGDFSGEAPLTWARRLKIVSGVAMALAYLHEEWEQRVIHRDVKSSNVMLDADFNARLGDFGLARLSEHDQAPPSTAVLAGTYGYLAPELGHTLKATEKTDVYSFGAVVLEVATGKRPLLRLEDRRTADEVLLVDWVWHLHKDETLLAAADPRLEGGYNPGEMVTLLKIGLLCSHPDPNERPNMREVLNIWKGSSLFPPLPRTKPIPIYSSAPTNLAFNSDGDTRAMIPTQDYDHSFSQSDSNFGVDYDGYTTEAAPIKDQGYSVPLENRQQSGEKRSSLTPGLRSRQWKSTPLPM